MGPFTQSQWSSWTYSGMSDPFTSYNQFPSYPSYLADSLEAYQTHHSRLVQQQQTSRTTDSKPRLSKEEVEILESEFQKNHKPSSTTKKALAESMRVDNARINNWFQNRRAREKKENNIREYETKQRIEKERTEAGEGPQPSNSRQRDLVASSAPFPQPGNLKQSIETSQSPSEQSLLDPSNDSVEPSQNGGSDHDIFSPLAFVIKSEVKGEDVDDPCGLSDQMDDYFSAQDGSFLKIDTKVADRHNFEHVTNQSVQDNVDGDQDADSPSTEASDVKSSELLENASRRCKRPAPLSIAGARSKSYITRSFDGEQSASMRRISSTGAGRVKKSVATPRSPFFDKHVDGLLHGRSSPMTAGRTGSAAPPTPDTPVAMQQHEPVDAALSALYSMNGKYTPPDLIISDPTLRTPPTTPGFCDHLYNLGTGYDLSISEETLVGPGMGRVNGPLSLSSNAMAFSNFLTNNQSSSQQIPPLIPTRSAQACFDFTTSADGNQEFDWSDLSPSTASIRSIDHRFMSLGHMDN